MNIKELRNRKLMTQTDLAEAVGVTIKTIRNWEKGVTTPKYDQVIAMNKVFGEDLSNPKPLQYLEEPQENYKTIPVSNQSVYATISPAMSDMTTLQPDTFIRIPMFSRGEFAVQVTGHSMKGYINNGDWAVIRKMNDPNRIIYGECYLIVTRANNLHTVKFLNEHEDTDLLWLSAYNSEQFNSQSIEKTDILELYQVIGRFSRVGS